LWRANRLIPSYSGCTGVIASPAGSGNNLKNHAFLDARALICQTKSEESKKHSTKLTENKINNDSKWLY
jgi:hypothetical protein